MASDIFTLNAGSSSIKFSLWHSATATELPEIFRGEIEKIGIAPHLSVRDPGSEMILRRSFDEAGGAKLTHEDLLRELFAWLSQQSYELKGIGHRVVHGGADFTMPVQVDDHVMER